MANYKLDYTGEQVNTAIGNALNGGGTQLYRHEVKFNGTGITDSQIFLFSTINVAIQSQADFNNVSQNSISGRGFIKTSSGDHFIHGNPLLKYSGAIILITDTDNGNHGGVIYKYQNSEIVFESNIAFDEAPTYTDTVTPL